MFNTNIQLGTINIELDNIKGTENGKSFAINGKINIGISVNSQLINRIEPLVDQAIRFNTNKQIGKDKIQRELDELELLEIKVRKARLLKQLRDLEK